MVERRRAWRAIDADLFRFTTTDLRDLHVALMAAFEDAAVLAPALNLEQVRAALTRSGWDEPVADDVLQRALHALVEWRLLESTQDHGAHYATPEEFERKNLQWSLTGRGEAAIGGLLHALDALRHAVGLQPAVLDAIGDGLADLADLLSSAEAGADGRIHVRLAEVEGHMTALVASVRQFNSHLQRLVREDATSDDVFVDVKRRTVSYLEEYVEGVERPQRRVAAAIERLSAGAGAATLFDRALVGANLAPVAGDDPAPAWLAERARRWEALCAWFTSVDGASPRITGLLDVARTAIVQLLRVLERRWDSRRRAASVAEDYKRLAALFAAAPGEAEAHRLFGAAFGLWPARHAHLSPADGQARAPATPWAEADGVDVAPALRTTGTLVNAGRVRPVADPARWRAQRQRAQAEALAAEDNVRMSLLTGNAVRLSAFGRLPAEAFAELLALLGAALDAPIGADGARRALSADGRVEVVLSDPGDRKQAVLHTASGTLRGPDLWVSIALAGEPARMEATGG